MRTVGLEVARHDGEPGLAAPAGPGRELLEGRAASAQHAMRPFEVPGPNAPGLVVEEGDFEVDGNGNLGPECPRIAPAGVPRDRVAPPDDRLLFLGDELVQKPEPRTLCRRPDGAVRTCSS